MNTRDLQYFVALVKYKNYTQVAKQFQVSQPTITQAIQRLEREFGAPLVRKDRVHRDEMITRSGRLLYANAQLINEKIELTHKEIRRANQKQIRFGMPPIIGKLYISKIVSEFSKDLLSRLKITSVGSHELLNQVRNGKIDIALLGSTAPINEPGVFADLIATRRFGVIVSTANPLAQRDQVSFKELANERFISFDQQYVHQAAFRAYCTYAQINPTVAMYRIPNISWIKELVRQDIGISLMVKDAVANEPGIKLVEITDPLPERFYISVAIREGYVLSADEQDFLDRLRKLPIKN
ncbi:LysR family transcriptional regulator [Limosilactobacillus pontis]|uniref:LysR family transcriptional regulator n=1 Tax=Limosilactobacillus pontis DSM 8475 TaxID=1423794 RepID=A0A922PTZ9_9LACO|nr:LysR family transcriptional regulator [Limosilactobacillus pontis]KRM35532.1 LysR family transcriptional regulator [Limosilactobacillus pontis DSM 8475]MCX2186247.1 LysR family transcriptional regulator [Limosilactobacillus pontis]MCX2187933.1 LysR family transcriptional regulator [Limosilactobacillus pontis]QFV01458.1 LysR family transcriptional regulator [Limosilactobacillus pontis]